MCRSGQPPARPWPLTGLHMNSGQAVSDELLRRKAEVSARSKVFRAIVWNLGNPAAIHQEDNGPLAPPVIPFFHPPLCRVGPPTQQAQVRCMVAHGHGNPDEPTQLAWGPWKGLVPRAEGSLVVLRWHPPNTCQVMMQWPGPRPTWPNG